MMTERIGIDVDVAVSDIDDYIPQCRPTSPSGNRPSKLLIHMELCDGTLTNYLKEIRERQNHIREKEIHSILVQILVGLCYCHSKGIVHRDLKSNNVLYTNQKCNCHFEESEHRIILSDFGFSKSIAPGISSGRGGSTGYRAHELLKSKQYSDRTDVWAFGCIIMDVASTGRRRAFHDDDAASTYGKGESQLPKLKSGDNPELDDSVLDHLNYLMELYLEKDPKDRPTAPKLLESIQEKWGRFGWVTL